MIDALAAGLPQVFADGHQLQQVLLNLIINAEQAMLSARRPRRRCVVRTWHDAEQESVVLEINDDGPGIPDDVQPKIFDPFFTTKDVGKGTGLGLTVAYAIVQEHGGTIRLESRPGAGASFYVELPVTGADLSHSPAMRARLRDPAAKWWRASRFWWWRTRRRSPTRWPKRCAMPATPSRAPPTAKRRWPRSWHVSSIW